MSKGYYTVDDLMPEMIQRYNEGQERGPMTDEPITWEWLVEREPALKNLEDRCKRLANPHKAHRNWYGGRGGLRIRSEVIALVGHGRGNPTGHPNLYGSDAYDLAYDRLLKTLEGKQV